MTDPERELLVELAKLCAEGREQGSAAITAWKRGQKRSLEALHEGGEVKFEITLEALPGGRRVRFTQRVNDIPGLQTDLRPDLLYESVTELTNNIVRGLVRQLEAQLKTRREQY